MSVGDSKKIKIFLIKNSAFNSKSLEVFLKRRDFEIKTDTVFEGLQEKVDEFIPDYIMMPWDHLDPNMRNFLSLIDSNQTPCISYITSTSTQDTRSLNALNFPLKLFPPISGPAVQRLILKIQKQRNTQANKTNRITSQAAAKTAVSQIYIAKGKRPGDIKKETQKVLSGIIDDLKPEFNFSSITDLTASVPISSFSNSMNMQISEAQKRSLAYKFDSKIQKDLIAFAESQKKTNAAENSTQDLSDNISDLLNQFKNLQENDLNPSQSFKNEKSVNSLNQHLEKIIKSPYGLLIQSLDVSGLILFHADSPIEIDEAEVFMQEWSNDLLTSFIKKDLINLSLHQSPIFNIQLPEHLDAFEICQNKSALHKIVNIDGNKTIMSFFDLKHNPFNIETANDDNFFIINLNCLTPNSSITFDLFYEMKQNEKVLKLFKTNSKMTEKELINIEQKKLFPLLVDSSYEINWYQYSVESFLAKP